MSDRKPGEPLPVYVYGLKDQLRTLESQNQALQEERLNLRRVAKAVAGIQDGCCGQAAAPMWCIHDYARSALSPTQEIDPSPPDSYDYEGGGPG